MSTPDLVIRNARIVDGTGAASIEGDLAIAEGRIVAVGGKAPEGRDELDADGRVVAPGFVDIHTHFDPQLCWDGLATPSLEHGVTTIVTGNCSLSLAPVRPGRSSKLVEMFEVIEDIKERTFDAAVPFSWESFPEYLDHLRPRLGINVGALVGHSALRYYVMGDESQERKATAAEIEEMCGLMEEAMAAGALGLSGSYVDADRSMRPVPCRFADRDEVIALCRAMRKSGRGVYQVVPYFVDLEQQVENIAELGEISRAADVLCSLQPILSGPGSPEARESIEAMEAEQAKGGRVFGQVMPRNFDLALRLSETSMLLFPLRTWKKIMDEPVEERIRMFSDPSIRPGLVEEMRNGGSIAAGIPFLRVGAVRSPENQRYVGKALVEIATEEGREIGDVLLDISLADDLEAEFRLEGVMNADKQAVAGLMDHPLCHVGASDAGAHVTQFCGTGDTTHLLEHYVRETGRMTLERAVHRLTGEVAEAWGLSDRGRLEEGLAADVVVFDPETVSVSGNQFVNDFPGEANRYVRRSEGYHAVVVNGEIAWQGGAYTGRRAGRIV